MVVVVWFHANNHIYSPGVRDSEQHFSIRWKSGISDSLNDLVVTVGIFIACWNLDKVVAKKWINSPNNWTYARTILLVVKCPPTNEPQYSLGLNCHALPIAIECNVVKYGFGFFFLHYYSARLHCYNSYKNCQVARPVKKTCPTIRKNKVNHIGDTRISMYALWLYAIIQI